MDLSLSFFPQIFYAVQRKPRAVPLAECLTNHTKYYPNLYPFLGVGKFHTSDTASICGKSCGKPDILSLLGCVKNQNWYYCKDTGKFQTTVIARMWEGCKPGTRIYGKLRLL